MSEYINVLEVSNINIPHLHNLVNRADAKISEMLSREKSLKQIQLLKAPMYILTRVLILIQLSLHVDESLKHFITDTDDLGVSLEAALGDDHLRELICKVNI